MKKSLLAVLTTCTLLVGIVASAQNKGKEETHQGIQTTMQSAYIDGKARDIAYVTSVFPGSTAEAQGIKAGDCLILSADPIPGKKGIRLGGDNIDTTFYLHTVKMAPCDAFITEVDRMVKDKNQLTGAGNYGDMTRSYWTIEQLEVFSDPEAPFYEYKSFDFEFTERNTIQQKTASALLESFLKQRGLVRDRENPDILIFIDVFSDKREQYVPPTQQMVTRYKYGYEIGSGWGTRQYVESQTQGNYTKVEYLNKYVVTMLDAKKAQAGGKVPPVIWNGNYEELCQEKPNLKEVLTNVSELMALFYPYKPGTVERVYDTHYPALGVLFDVNQMQRVVCVLPNSAAEKAGIKINDLIIKASVGLNSDQTAYYDAVLKRVGSKKRETLRIEAPVVRYIDFEGSEIYNF